MSKALQPLFVARAVVLTLAASSLAGVLVSGPATRMELWDWRFGLTVMKYSTFLGIAAAIGALILIVMLAAARFRVRSWMPVLSLVIALAAIVPPLMSAAKAKSLPFIHDISTDLADPPAFVALLEARKASPNGAAHAGAKVAEEQRKGYPDIKPLIVKDAPPAAFQKAIDAARAMGWQVAAADSASGRLEATHTTTFFGFKDDVVVRIRPEGTGSRVDVRSVSRVGQSDIGANAKRIREFVARLA